MLISFKSAKPVIENRSMGIIPCALQGWENNRVWRLVETGEVRAEMEREIMSGSSEEFI